MPVHSCQEDGKPGWKWSGSGKCYTYTSGSKDGSKRAHDKADAQGAAAHASGYEGTTKSSGIQSVRFRKDMFNKQQAISWAKSHGFKYNDVEETQNQWRLRQFPPGECLRSGGMKHLDDGISAYICPTTSTIKSILDNISMCLDNLKNNV